VKKCHGLTISRITINSAAYEAGLCKGDILFFVNGTEIEHELDFSFLSAEPILEIEFERRGERFETTIIRHEGEMLGISFVPSKIKRCHNRCLFCFVDQLPSGMRKSLYVKDEDFRHSFMHGNYITLTNVNSADLEKIATYGYSPLFISVHATSCSVRRKMLGNKNAGTVIQQLRYLQKRGITFHTQIVVCPGINDQSVLAKTIEDLLALQEGCLSIAVVPVGITRFRSGLKAVSQKEAREICAYVDGVGGREKKHRKKRRLYLADEFYIKAGKRIPSHSYYESYGQIENGVGLIRKMLMEWDIWKKSNRGVLAESRASKPQRFLFITGVSPTGYIKKIAKEIESLIADCSITVLSVANTFFGESVTVTGLLTARDILKTVRSCSQGYSAVFLPAVIFNYRGITLDGFSQKRLQDKIGLKSHVCSSIADCAQIIRENYGV